MTRHYEGMVNPSVFDRLSLEEPDRLTVPQYKQTLSRDLSGLLNKRCIPLDDPGEEVAKSILAFGLPDFSSPHISSENAKEVVQSAVERAIELFEPRLSGVRVAAEAADEKERSIKLVITATMSVEPYEDLLFHAVFETATREVRIDVNTE